MWEKADHCDLLQTKIWGCQDYVFDPTLQSGKKNEVELSFQIVKFWFFRMALIANCLSSKFGNWLITQFHVISDDKFETVFSIGEDDVVIGAICNEFLRTNEIFMLMHNL